MWAYQLEAFKSEEWFPFVRKMDMIIEELQAYGDLQKALDELLDALAENHRKRTKQDKKLGEVIKSAQTTFGFFNKISKEDRVKTIRSKLAALEGEIAVKERLKAMVVEVILREEIPVFVRLKSTRFAEIVKEFARARLRYIDQEQAFWHAVIEKEDAVLDSEMVEAKLAEDNPRLSDYLNNNQHH